MGLPHAVHHALLRAGVRISGGHRCLLVYEAREVIAAAFAFFPDARALAGAAGIDDRRLRVGFCALGARGSDLDTRLEHGGDGRDRVVAAAVDRGAGAGHDCDAQPARWREPRVVRKVLVGLDPFAHARSDSDHEQFLIFRALRVNSVGRSDGGGFCVWQPAAAPRSTKRDSDDWRGGDSIVLRASWNQFLRERYRRFAVAIPALRRIVDGAANVLADPNFIL